MVASFIELLIVFFRVLVRDGILEWVDTEFGQLMIKTAYLYDESTGERSRPPEERQAKVSFSYPEFFFLPGFGCLFWVPTRGSFLSASNIQIIETELNPGAVFVGPRFRTKNPCRGRFFFWAWGANLKKNGRVWEGLREIRYSWVGGRVGRRSLRRKGFTFYIRMFHRARRRSTIALMKLTSKYGSREIEKTLLFANGARFAKYGQEWLPR